MVVPAAAGAQAAPVDSASLSWTQANVFESTAPAGTNRTWLGYVSSSPAPRSPSGTATPVAPASGPTVTPASDRGVDRLYTWTFPSTSGSYDPSIGVGSVQFDGGVRFFSAQPPAGHGFTIALDDPQLVLNGLTGLLRSSGEYVGAAGVEPYADQPVYNLDLSGSEVVLRADGSREISGIVPTLAVTGLPFPGNYSGGVAGPDRTPNTFGSFSLKIRTEAVPVAQGPKGDTGATGAAGVVGAAGPAGPAGVGATGSAPTIRDYVVYLRTAPYTGKGSNRVTLRRAGKTVASGTIRGRVLRVRLASGVSSIFGRYTIRLSGGSKRETGVVVG